MNDERELLRKILRDTQYINYECNDKIRNEIEELLAQPEQEPIAYVADPSVGFDVSRSTQGLTPREALTEYKRGYARAELDLKREPLSYEQIEAAREGNTITVHAFARAIEKAHGIGGGE